MAVTLHTCNGGNGYWDNCDRGGCQTNAFYANGNLMCPEDRCTINTNRPFTVSHYQAAGQGPLPETGLWFVRFVSSPDRFVNLQGHLLTPLDRFFGVCKFSR